MKLIECYIENFGKLHAYSHRFSDGLNTVLEDNGFGKTTLSVFIKVMLYGFEDTKKHSIAENDRKHYLPWGGGVCGGWLTFSVGGVKYKVERTFGVRASEDTYTLYDTVKGRVSTAFLGGLGEGLFGIDSDGFERTVFLSERRFSVKNDNKSLSAKLSDLVGFEWDVGALDDATDALDERRKYYYKRGGGGRIGEIKEEVAECDRQIIEISGIGEELARCEGELAAVKGELSALEKKRAELTRCSSLGEAARLYRARAAELEARKRELADIEKALGGRVPDEAELYGAERAAERARLIEERLATVKDTRDRAAQIERELREARAHISATRSIKGRKKPIWAFTLGAVLGAAGAAVAGFMLEVGIALIACAAVMLCVGAFLLSRSGSTPDLRSTEEFLLHHGYSASTREEYFSALNAIIAALEAEYAILSRHCLELEELQTELARRKEEALAPLSGAEELGEQPYLTLRRLASRHAQISALARGLGRELDELARTAGIEPMAPSTQDKAEAEHCDPAALEAQIHEHRVRMATLETRCNAYRDSLAERDELCDRRAELEEERAEAEQRLRLITLTKEHLLGAKDSLTVKYLGKTRERFNHYVSLLCRESPELFTLSVDFSITKDEAARARAEDAFSLGTRELYAIAARLALADSLFGNEAPPLILDDPFCHLDDKKCALALAALKRLSAHRQIIYFTCSESRTV